MKKLKKEIGEADSVSLRFLRQLLPLPKLFEAAITCEPFGTVTDAKGNKVKGFNVDKKYGLQVSDKQRLNPWDFLEVVSRSVAPLSWQAFSATRNEKKPLK